MVEAEIPTMRSNNIERVSTMLENSTPNLFESPLESYPPDSKVMTGVMRPEIESARVRSPAVLEGKLEEHSLVHQLRSARLLERSSRQARSNLILISNETNNDTSSTSEV